MSRRCCQNRRRLRAGMTRWLPTVYRPGKLRGYEDEFVATVYRVAITSVRGSTVRYTTGGTPYQAGRKWVLEHTFLTRSRGMEEAVKMLEQELVHSAV